MLEFRKSEWILIRNRHLSKPSSDNFQHIFFNFRDTNSERSQKITRFICVNFFLYFFRKIPIWPTSSMAEVTVAVDDACPPPKRPSFWCMCRSKCMVGCMFVQHCSKHCWQQRHLHPSVVAVGIADSTTAQRTAELFPAFPPSFFAFFAVNKWETCSWMCFNF